MSGFAPSPMHGAAYAVAIETVGGIGGISDCSTTEKHHELLGKLDALLEWAHTQSPEVLAAYQYGVDMVRNDLKGRIDIYDNSRRVKAALATLPRPPQ